MPRLNMDSAMLTPAKTAVLCVVCEALKLVLQHGTKWRMRIDIQQIARKDSLDELVWLC